ncbi:hypothetical protein PMI54_005367 [Salmonella enterica]|nr:hypothetical protein [Salmonella enterica]
MKKRGAIVIYTAHKGYRLRFNASCFTVGRDYLVVAPQIFMLSKSAVQKTSGITRSTKIQLSLFPDLRDGNPSNDMIIKSNTQNHTECDIYHHP